MSLNCGDKTDIMAPRKDDTWVRRNLPVRFSSMHTFLGLQLAVIGATTIKQLANVVWRMYGGCIFIV